MPGSLLTAMTGGEIRPLYHQVRNFGLPRRCSILLLVNPPIDQPTAPFVSNGLNRDVDVARLAREGGQMFGLPDVPVA
jgi:isopenicillin N synthase-like dioxygenase